MHPRNPLSIVIAEQGVQAYMNRVERGAGNPSLDAIETFAGALGVPVKELFESARGRAKAR
jgi:transcriptional regulator with XRE-family HTH domain